MKRNGTNFLRRVGLIVGCCCVLSLPFCTATLKAATWQNSTPTYQYWLTNYFPLGVNDPAENGGFPVWLTDAFAYSPLWQEYQNSFDYFWGANEQVVVIPHPEMSEAFQSIVRVVVGQTAIDNQYYKADLTNSYAMTNYWQKLFDLTGTNEMLLQSIGTNTADAAAYLLTMLEDNENWADEQREFWIAANSNSALIVQNTGSAQSNLFGIRTNIAEGMIQTVSALQPVTNLVSIRSDLSSYLPYLTNQSSLTNLEFLARLTNQSSLTNLTFLTNQTTLTNLGGLTNLVGLTNLGIVATNLLDVSAQLQQLLSSNTSVTITNAVAITNSFTNNVIGADVLTNDIAQSRSFLETIKDLLSGNTGTPSTNGSSYTSETNKAASTAEDFIVIGDTMLTGVAAAVTDPTPAGNPSLLKLTMAGHDLTFDPATHGFMAGWLSWVRGTLAWLILIVALMSITKDTTQYMSEGAAANQIKVPSVTIFGNQLGVLLIPLYVGLAIAAFAAMVFIGIDALTGGWCTEIDIGAVGVVRNPFAGIAAISPEGSAVLGLANTILPLNFLVCALVALLVGKYLFIGAFLLYLAFKMTLPTVG